MTRTSSDMKIRVEDSVCKHIKKNQNNHEPHTKQMGVKTNSMLFLREHSSKYHKT
jgi:hypothetical protein